MTVTLRWGTAAFVGLALLISACGGGEGTQSSPPPSPPHTTAPSQSTTTQSSVPPDPAGGSDAASDPTVSPVPPAADAVVDMASALFPEGEAPQGTVFDLYELIHGTTTQRMELAHSRFTAFQNEIGACLAESGFSWDPIPPSLAVLTSDLEGSVPAFDRIYPDGFGITDQAVAAAAAPISNGSGSGSEAELPEETRARLVEVLGAAPDSYILTVFQPGNYTGSTLDEVSRPWPRPDDGFNCLERGWQAGQSLDAAVQSQIEDLDTALGRAAEQDPQAFIDIQETYMGCMAEAGLSPGEYGDRYSMMDPVREILARGTGGGNAERARELELEIATADARCWSDALGANADRLRQFRDSFVADHTAELDQLARFWADYTP